MTSPSGPFDPMTDMDVLAATIAEQFFALVKAGIPPNAVAIMLGMMLGTMASSGQKGDDR